MVILLVATSAFFGESAEAPVAARTISVPLVTASPAATSAPRRGEKPTERVRRWRAVSIGLGPPIVISPPIRAGPAPQPRKFADSRSPCKESIGPRLFAHRGPKGPKFAPRLLSAQNPRPTAPSTPPMFAGLEGVGGRGRRCARNVERPVVNCHSA